MSRALAILWGDEEVPTDPAELMKVRGEIGTLVEDLRAVRQMVDQALATAIGAGGAYRYGDSIVVARGSRSWRPFDETSLLDWLGPDLSRAVRASDCRIRAIQQVATERGPHRRHDPRDLRGLAGGVGPGHRHARRPRPCLDARHGRGRGTAAVTVLTLIVLVGTVVAIGAFCALDAWHAVRDEREERLWSRTEEIE